MTYRVVVPSAHAWYIFIRLDNIAIASLIEWIFFITSANPWYIIRFYKRPFSPTEKVDEAVCHQHRCQFRIHFKKFTKLARVH